MARDTSRLWPDRPLVVGSYVVVLLLAVALFASVFPAYVTAETAYRVDVTATDYEIRDDGETLVVTIELQNPTDHGFRILSLSSSAKLGVYVGQDRLSTATGTAVEGTTVPAGGTGTVTATFQIEESYRKTLRDYVESGRLVMRGELEGRVVEKRVGISVKGVEVRSDE